MRRSSTGAIAAAEAGTPPTAKATAMTPPPRRNTGGTRSSGVGVGKMGRRISSAADFGEVVVGRMELNSMGFLMRTEKQGRNMEVEKPLEGVELGVEVMKKMNKC